jgi:crotonobetainyl-CoA:carnitine CoA-transferase CaiB-like acyl-CoA transferase
MATPELGEHTDALLAELGYDADAVAQLRQHNVV